MKIEKNETSYITTTSIQLFDCKILRRQRYQHMICIKEENKQQQCFESIPAPNSLLSQNTKMLCIQIEAEERGKTYTHTQMYKKKCIENVKLPHFNLTDAIKLGAHSKASKVRRNKC